MFEVFFAHVQIILIIYGKICNKIEDEFTIRFLTALLKKTGIASEFSSRLPTWHPYIGEKNVS